MRGPAQKNLAQFEIKMGKDRTEIYSLFLTPFMVVETFGVSKFLLNLTEYCHFMNIPLIRSS